MYLSSFDHLINLAHSKKGMGETRHHKANGGPVSTAGDIEKQSQYGSAFYAPTAADDTSYMNPQTGPAMLTGGAPKAKGGQVRRRCHKEYGGPVGSGDGGPVTQQMLNQQISQGEGYHNASSWAGMPGVVEGTVHPARRGGEIRGRHSKKR